MKFTLYNKGLQEVNGREIQIELDLDYVEDVKEIIFASQNNKGEKVTKVLPF